MSSLIDKVNHYGLIYRNHIKVYKSLNILFWESSPLLSSFSRLTFHSSKYLSALMHLFIITAFYSFLKKATAAAGRQEGRRVFISQVSFTSVSLLHMHAHSTHRYPWSWLHCKKNPGRAYKGVLFDESINNIYKAITLNDLWPHHRVYFKRRSSTF